MFTKNITSFEQRVYAVMAATALVCGVLMIISLVQGPRVRSATVDRYKVTLSANQRLLLHMNQSTGTITQKQVSITPAVPFTVTSGGNTVALQFARPLQNDVQYAVRVHTPDKRHVFGYTFKTASVVLYYMADGSGNSTIHRKELGSGKDEAVFSANAINDYLVIGDMIVVAQRNKDATSNLFTYNMATQQRLAVRLPEKGMIMGLRAAPDGQSFGFLFTALDPQSQTTGSIILCSLNKRLLSRVVGFDGEPAKVLNWYYAQDSTTILAQMFDANVVLFNPHKTPILLGEYSTLGGFTYNDTGIVLYDISAGPLFKDLKTAAQTVISVPSAGGYITQVDPLRTQDGYILHVQLSGAGVTGQQLFIDAQGRRKEIYRISGNDGYLSFAYLSSNDQYVAVEHRTNNDSGPRKVDIVQTGGGKVVVLDGQKVRWATEP
jgi:hypothetical protein